MSKNVLILHLQKISFQNIILSSDCLDKFVHFATLRVLEKVGQLPFLILAN